MHENPWFPLFALQTIVCHRQNLLASQIIVMNLNIRVLKALGSETRLQIIKQLTKRRMTLTELSHSLGMHASTVKEHLDFMSTTGLVALNDEGRKWKYYSLTSDCRKLLSPYPSEIRILIPAAVLLFAVGFFGVGAGQFSQKAMETAGGVEKSTGIPTTITPTTDVAALMLGIASLLILISAYLIARKAVFLDGLKAAKKR